MKRVCLWEFVGTMYRIQVHHGVLQAEKKEKGRFLKAVVLTEHATDDFDVTATEKYLHCVSRTENEVLYFLFDGTNWHKKVLASGENRYRNLTLFARGDFVHFLYNTPDKEEQVLVHRLLGELRSAPVVVATKATLCSSVLHENGDLTILFSREDALYIRQFIWSQKAFSTPHSLELGCHPTHAVLHVEGDRIFVAGYAVSGCFVNLLCGEFSKDGARLCLAAVHLLSANQDALCFTCKNEKLFLCWCEGGTVLQAEYQNPGHWSSPRRFLPVTGRQHLLFSTPQGVRIGYWEKETPKYYL